MVQGECNCGAVSFTVDAGISDVFVCHCSICRRSTGSGGIAVAVVANKTFAWIKGQDQISYWSKPGHEWHTYFCQVCGTAVPGENDAESMYLPVGTLTSGCENLRVAHHLYVHSKASWEEIGDSGKQHIENYEAEV
ncbi:GFA family protein [Microbulbifer sp. 2304DJ12-6]|uniref:GFA family protein n=1 Tax=Microbulbifer sp. 2304DJ12-6 TaxID=3233340 RepID=UPI0039AFD6D5